MRSDLLARLRIGWADDHPQTILTSGRRSTAASEALTVLRSAGTHPILRSFPQGAIIVFDADLRYLAAGGLGLPEVGLSRAMLEGHTIYEVFPPDVVGVIEPLYRQALAGHESSIDVPYQGRIYLQRLGPLYDADGGIVAGMGFTQDVTAARDAERRLQDSETRFRMGFDHGPVPMVVIAPDGGHHQVNPAMCAFTGYTAHELVAMTMADLTHPDDLAADAVPVAELRSGERTTYTRDKRYLRADGAVVWGTVSATLVRRTDGSPLDIIAQIHDITERKRHEQLLAEEHRRLLDAESIGHVGSWGLELATRAVTWSAGLFELYGFDPERFDGSYSTALACIHPDDRARVDAGVETCIRTGEPLRDRYRINRAGDDALRWIETRGEAQYEHGVRVRICGAIADVTDQVEAATAAEAAQSFQHAIFTASPDIITVWDFLAGSMLWSNGSVPGRLGYSAEEAAAMGSSPARFLVVAEDRAQYEATLAAAQDATDDEVIRADFRMARKDGTIRWFSRRSAPLQRDENGRVTRIVGITRDTTDEMAVQAALVESQNRFHQLADTVTVGFILRSLDPPAFLYVSPGFVKIFGCDPMATSERPDALLRRIVHPDDHERARKQYWDKAAAGITAQAEFRILRPDGEIRWIAASSAPVVDPDGVIRRMASTSEDVTDRKLAEAAQHAADQLAQANAVKDRMLSRMSHELRTPLNAVLGFAQLLELDELSPTQHDSVRHILDGGQHLLGIVEDILDLTKIQSNAMDLATQPFAIAELLAQTVALMQPAAVAGGITLAYDPALIGGLLVQADRLRLRQVVLNLLSNAIKFNRPGGRVELTGVLMDDQLDIMVTDTGRGVATADLPRLFTPFERLTAPAAGIDGTGLGLTLSRDLMEAMGGTLHAVSTEGVGSTFTASVPVVHAS